MARPEPSGEQSAASTGVGRSGSLPSETMAPVLTRPAEETRLGPAARPLPQLPVELTASKNLDRRQSAIPAERRARDPAAPGRSGRSRRSSSLMAVTTIVYLVDGRPPRVRHAAIAPGHEPRHGERRPGPGDPRRRAAGLHGARPRVPGVGGDAQAAREPAGDRVPERQARREAAARGRRRRDDRRRAAATRSEPRSRSCSSRRGDPRTKPKALNYGLTIARGEFVTIYDAEDHPDPLQLRRAVYAFQHLPPEIVCLQAELTFDNTDQNLITRWFTIEYLMWFTLFLPGLASTDAPVPLGGTSNHMRRDALEAIGAWDPYNVTEDADLGIRLHRLGRPDCRARVRDLRGGEQRLRQLGEAAVALVQGLPPDVARAPPPPGRAVPRARARAASCSTTCSSAARRCSRCSTRSSG